MGIVKNLEELKEFASKDGGFECSIVLKGGLASTKHLFYMDKKWTVANMIDGTLQEDLSDKELSSQTNVIKALRKGSLIY